jgi:phage portal protein BeeE
LLAGERSAIVERCISLYAQTIASLPPSHWRANGRGGRTRVTNSALSCILRKPNDYQSISDFVLNAVRSLYVEGNCYALVFRNERFEVGSIHLMNARQSSQQVSRTTGDVFYALGAIMSLSSRSKDLQNSF